MTTDWWNTAQSSGERPEGPTQATAPIPTPAPERPASPPPAPESEDEGGEGASNGKAMKVMGLAVGAVVAGLVILNSTSGGDEPDRKASSSASAPAEAGDLPAAGSLPQGGTTPVASDEPSARQSDSEPAPAPKVTLDAVPSGTGRVGAVVKVTIHNGTADPVTVLSSMVKGDGRPAVVGEGTLAPGSRSIQPGETATGTVEFSSKAAPEQIALLDLSGNVVAVSG